MKMKLHVSLLLNYNTEYMYHQLTVVQLERIIINQNKSMLITRYIEDIYMCISNKYILISKYTGIGKQFISSQRTGG